MERPLTDKQIEDQLQQLFGLECPENSEDDYEEDECDSEELLSTLDFTAEAIPLSATPGNETDHKSPNQEGALDSDEYSGMPQLAPPRRQANIESSESVQNLKGTPQLAPPRNRRLRQTVIESSESDEESDNDELDWKKTLWDKERPDPEDFYGNPLQAAVFFPSRTSPLAYFTRYFNDEVMDLIVEHTNLYASQNRSKNWEPVTVTEIKLLLGIIILMGLHDLPNFNLFWSSDPFFRVDEIAQVMTCKRYKKIMENLHLNDNTQMPSRNDPNYDKLYKVRPLLDLINTACNTEAKPTLCQSIDEGMIKFKGRSSLKQYMPLKPIKRGFKVWVRADSQTGYVFEFEIYTGKSSNNTPELGLGANVVKSLTKALIDKQLTAHVTFDNFFSSHALVQYLFDHGICSTATVNSNRRDLPKLVKDKEKAQENKKLTRGQYKWRVKNDVAFIVWKDTKPVTILTSAFHPSMQSVCNRTMKDETSEKISCPEAIKQYTKRMGGVDRFDQKRGTYEVGRKSKKWWRRIFYFLIDLSITNTYLLYHKSLRVPNPMFNLQFRLAIARALISNCSTRKTKFDSLPRYAAKKQKVFPSANYQKAIGVPDEIRFRNVGTHMPHGIEGYRRCRLCSTKVTNVRTKIMCNMCLVPLCVFPCFMFFHSE